ncbi:hypothetical protein ASNO1_33090 [Corallococcus caeni]|uniref:YhcG N-terminal domain-containing protein n=1 Tax=Corallococcus caeni TaxID=3082388 RepID=A0ABQ6QT84_9BACT|nr:hypothetical protein ASNO1_33090 [Corallococcus sp. NO1]
MTQLPWTHHLIILSEAKPVQTREFYLLAALQERWSKRELERQLRSGAVLREAKAVPPSLTPVAIARRGPPEPGHRARTTREGSGYPATTSVGSTMTGTRRYCTLAAPPAHRGYGNASTTV